MVATFCVKVNMRILLAGPGTGKTTKIKGIIDDEFGSAKRIIVLSFTNFTVNDLTTSFADPKYGNVECATLHKFALKLNHLKDYHILSQLESDYLSALSQKLSLDLATIYSILHCITFDAMISSCLAFIRTNPEYVKDTLGGVDLLLVDEFQDFNPDEQLLVLEIAKIASETIILGDDDQSIYGFKDAKPDGIIGIFNDPGVIKIAHENNCYRCPDCIVDHATELITRNQQRVQKTWNKTGKEGKVSFNQLRHLTDSDAAILTAIKTIKANNPESSILVLSRWKVIVNGLKQLLENENIQYVDCWFEDLDIELYKRIWWLNAIYGRSRMPFLIFLLKAHGSLTKAKALPDIEAGLKTGFDEDTLIQKIQSKKYLSEPFVGYLLNAPEINEFFANHPEFEELKEHIDLDNPKNTLGRLAKACSLNKDFQKGKINLMSIHKSKGLQADHVIINGLVAGILPNEATGFESIEAERRLLFVAITRTGEELHLFATMDWQGATLNQNMADKSQFNYRFWERLWRGQTSPFVGEMNVNA